VPSALRTLLAAKSISTLGNQITLVALPLTAILFLHATPFQMGLLAGAGTLPGVLFGLLAGVAIEPLPKRAILLAANLASAALLALIPISHAIQLLSFGLLVAINFTAAGIANTEGIALMSFLAAIVPKPQLATANSQYAALTSATAVIGPALAGLLVALLTAPGAISLDASTFLAASALMLFLPSTPTTPPETTESITTRLRTGLDFTFSHPVIRLFTLFAIAINTFGSGIAALQALFIVKQLGVPTTWYGATLAAAGIGAIGGALISGRAARRLNINALLAGVIAIDIVADGIICSLHGAPLHAAAGFAAAQLVNGIGNGLLGAAVMTYIQTSTPPEILARVIGALTTILSASVPLGALAAGAIGNAIGLRPTLILETAGFAVTLAVVLITAKQSLLKSPTA
jgi:MFS family permease